MVFKIQSIQKQVEENQKQKRIKFIQERDRAVLLNNINNMSDSIDRENKKRDIIIAFFTFYVNFDILPKQYSEKFSKLTNGHLLDMNKKAQDRMDLINKIDNLRSQKSMTLSDKNQLVAHTNQLFRMYYHLIEGHKNELQMVNRQLEYFIEETKDYFLLPVVLDFKKNQITYRK